MYVFGPTMYVFGQTQIASLHTQTHTHRRTHVSSGPRSDNWGWHIAEASLVAGVVGVAGEVAS